MIARAVAIVLLFYASSALADFGRLFFTSAQRSTLDTARKQNIRSEIANEGEQQPQAAPPPPLPQNISVNGVVRSSDGKSTVWVNSRPVTGQQAEGVKIITNKNDNRVRITIPERGRSLDLKVGQTAEIVSGTIAEGYNQRPMTPYQSKTTTGTENASVEASKVISGGGSPAPKPPGSTGSVPDDARPKQ